MRGSLYTESPRRDSIERESAEIVYRESAHKESLSLSPSLSLSLSLYIYIYIWRERLRDSLSREYLERVSFERVPRETLFGDSLQRESPRKVYGERLYIYI